MTPKTYRKKPVEIQAMQWTGTNGEAMFAWLGEERFTHEAPAGFTAMIYVAANDTWLGIETGEWVLKDAKGFYPCKPDIFEQTYAPVESAGEVAR